MGEHRPLFPALHPNEGPNPEGVANKLRRERDEARAERETFRGQLSDLKNIEALEWALICTVASAYSRSNFTTVPQDELDRLYAYYARTRCDWDGYEDYIEAGRPDLNKDEE
jgi:hypothetical protein